eukprot:7818143-Pyramimonas_sp.AAC.1
MARTHPAYASWSHRELHRGPQWHGSHAAPSPRWHTAHTLRGHIGSSIEGLSGIVRMSPPLHFGTLLT